MTDCNDTLRELYEYLDQELTPDRRQHLKDHHDDCGPCLAAYDFEAELRAVVKQRCTETVPDSLRSKIAKALGDEGCAEAATVEGTSEARE